MKPLSDCETGTQNWINRLHGGKEFAGRMSGLGFTPGTKVVVIQNYGHGPIIVEIRATRLALGRGEAAKVFVKPAKPE